MPQVKKSIPSNTRFAHRIAQICVAILLATLPYTAFSQQSSVDTQPSDEVIEFLLAGDWLSVMTAVAKSSDSHNAISAMLIAHALINSNNNHMSQRFFSGVRDSTQLVMWVNWCADFLDKHPDHPIALYLYSDAMFRVGDNMSAILALDRAILSSNPEPYLYHWRGMIQLSLGNFEMGLADLDHALAIDSNFAEAHYNRGLGLFMIKKYKLASEEYLKAIKINSKDTKSYVNLSSILYQSGVYQKAIEMAYRALQLDSTLSIMYFQIGQSHEQLKHPRIAIETYENFLKSNPPKALESLIKEAKERIKTLRKEIKGNRRHRRH